MSEPKPDNVTLIQSTIERRFFVSTALRTSSAPEMYSSTYFETIAWELNEKTQERGSMIEQENAGSSPRQAIESHVSLCQSLILNSWWRDREEMLRKEAQDRWPSQSPRSTRSRR